MYVYAAYDDHRATEYGRGATVKMAKKTFTKFSSLS